jgi:hypothetical protein
MPGEGRDLSSRRTQYVVRDLEIGQPNNSEECSETADGVAKAEAGYRFYALWWSGARSVSKTLTGNHRPFPSGSAKLPAGPMNYQLQCRDCGPTPS